MNKLIATNVMYLTSACNIRCEYCFEKDGRPNKSMSVEEVDKRLKWIDENLADHSHIVLFGGEPLLKIDLVEHIVNELITTYKHRNFSVSLDTNGLLLLDDIMFERYKNIITKRQFTTRISYDGPNSFRRKDINGNCVNDKIVKIIKKFEINNLNYSISFTWQRDNDKTIIYDLIYIFEKFNPERLVISPACRELSELSGKYYFDYFKTKIPYFEAIFLEYKKPICEFVCHLCNICQHNTKNIYYIPNKEPFFLEKSTEKAFDFWD